jgi:hypothetical protein
VFAVDESALLEEAHAAQEAWTRAGRDGAEEAFGDWQLVADAVADRLLDIRERYASTLDEESGEEYRAVFGRAAERRYGDFTQLLD